MATFVIVHGGWGGGWEWTPVAHELRGRGHEVYTPTLTGLGERAPLASEVGLNDHIADVEAVFHYERLDDVMLCGQSYGGMVVTGAADRAADAVRLVAYLDAFVPGDGQAVADLVSPEFREFIRLAERRGDDVLPYPEALWPPEGSLPEPVRSNYLGRILPHPVRTMTEPVSLTGAVERLPRAFVRCTGGEHGEPEPEMERFAQRARAEGWTYRESATPHDLQLYDPAGTAEILHGLATAAAQR